MAVGRYDQFLAIALPGKRVPTASDTMTNPRALEHELKNYLAIILGFAELLLQEAAPDDPRREDFEEIHKAATAAVRIVSSIGATEP